MASVYSKPNYRSMKLFGLGKPAMLVTWVSAISTGGWWGEEGEY